MFTVETLEGSAFTEAIRVLIVGLTVTWTVSSSQASLGSQTSSSKTSAVWAWTSGAVKLRVAVSAPLRLTFGPEVWVQA